MCEVVGTIQVIVQDLAPVHGEEDNTFLDAGAQLCFHTYVAVTIVNFYNVVGFDISAISAKERSMTNWIIKSIGILGLSVFFSVGPVLQGKSLAQSAPTKDSKTTKPSSAKTTEKTSAPTDQELADVKVKGMVWANT